MADIEKIARDIVDIYERFRKHRPKLPRVLFIDTRCYPVSVKEAVEALKNENIKACFPDGSEYFHGLLVKGPDPAYTASPEALSRLNARIATMSLPPRRLTMRPYNVYALGQWNFKEEE